KNWLTDIHHKCKGNRLQNYMDEFHFRFNRRAFLDTILDKLMATAMQMKPVPYKSIRFAN
ncbi:MAG: hypothetical protein ACKVOM_01265, partial [Ferruginibacter sp.]